MKKFVIAIGREYGSGGKEIGEKLSEKLNVKCYDKELITLAAQEGDFCEEVVEYNDERRTGNLLYNTAVDNGNYGYVNQYTILPLNHRVFLAQFEAIRKLALKESCIIVGRCADYALAGQADCISVFIHASDMDFRKERVKTYVDKPFKDDRKLVDFINKTDKKRANYYNYFSNKRWGDSRSYDLSIDSSRLGIDQTVDLIIEYLKLRTQEG